ncbi:MAG: heme ABC exporter ATP-binding protein CcmA [Solirubrobacterales bacterium]|nr:heme ABC exporter ATP-binding protein CcmA [Solirubrobacterales bacterium]MCB8971889.1 heme ABC exporter ATP-binding protein CcmA [Thermoleophilales bacterium]MCO5326306.1 heme ABC exporter ATP-binding protein CcmA [Solirubrobacterales bacterium]
MAEPAPEPALRASSLSQAYGESWVLRDVSFELPAGGTLAVIGPNGAGKSTLLQVLATLLRPSSGSVSVLGSELPGSAWKLRGRLGYLGHSPLLYRDLAAAENLRFHARLFGLPAEGAERIADLLERVGLAHRASTRVGEMSAGMVKRLAVCRALLHDPEMLVLDEPLANLDPAGADVVAPLLGPRRGRSRVLVTHDVAAALSGADRVLALTREGSVAFEAPAAEVDPDRARSIYSEESLRGAMA